MPKKTPPQTPDLKALGAHHAKMAQMHAKEAKEAAERGDGALSEKHSAAQFAHQEAAGATASGGGPATSKASDDARRATKAALGHGKPQVEPRRPAPSQAASTGDAGPPAGKPAAQPGGDVGGRSKEGLKVIAIGPKGGKIVGYTTKDGKRKAIYEGSKAAQKLASTVATHAEPTPTPAADDKAQQTPAEPSQTPPPGSRPDVPTQADETAPAAEPAASDADPTADAAPGDPTEAAGQGEAPAAPSAPAEPIDDKPISPDEPPGGTPPDAQDPDAVGQVGPKTDSPDARHAEQIAQLRTQIAEGDRKLKALAHHIDANLTPMYNNLRQQARAAHGNPDPSVVMWLLKQIGRFATFVLGLHEDKGAVSASSAADAIGETPPAKAGPKPKKAPKPTTPEKPETRAPVNMKSLAPGRPLSKAAPSVRYAQALVRLLATLQALERSHHAAHLQASGDNATEDHNLFGRLYEGIQGEIDGLSEKMVATLGPAVVDADSMAEDAAEILVRWGDGSDDPLQRALDAERELQAAIVEALAMRADLTPGMENHLQGLADTHDTAIYLLGRKLDRAGDLLRSTEVRQRRELGRLLKSIEAARV